MLKKNEYFGIGVYRPKTEVNVGTLWRSAINFGANFIFTIGHRYRRQAADTTKAPLKIPLFHYVSFDEFLGTIPGEAMLIAVEQSKDSIDICSFRHPERAIYLLGAEDHGIPQEILSRCLKTVHI